jgi:predicted RNA binding protein YcfA (HicA-like mRNA interferase family)
MKLPRDLPGRDLAHELERAFGYRQVHQEGSHMILQTDSPGHHRIPVPDHKALRLGTLNAILRAVAQAHGLGKEEVAQRLFG